MRKQLEQERRGDLVGKIGHTNVEEGQVDLQDVALDDLEVVLMFASDKDHK